MYYFLLIAATIFNFFVADAVGADSTSKEPLNMPVKITTGHKIVHSYQSYRTYEGYPPSSLPFGYFDEVQYGFFGIVKNATTGFYEPASNDPWGDFQKPYNTSGSAPIQGNLGEFWKLKLAGFKFNFQLIIGGWVGSALFPMAVATDSSRDYLTNAIVAILQKYPFMTGVSFDWEQNWGSSAQNPTNYILTVQLLRTKLQSVGLGYLLIQHYSTPYYATWVNIDPVQLNNTFDEILVMAYNFNTGAWKATTTCTHGNNLYMSKFARISVHDGLATYLSRGIPASKIIIGVQFHSPNFVASSYPGMGQIYNQSAPQLSYDFIFVYQMPPAGCEEFWDSTANATWAYCPNGTVFSYESVQSVAAKAKYVQDKGYLGIYTWDVTMDYPISNGNSRSAALTKLFRNISTIDPFVWPSIATVSNHTTTLSNTILTKTSTTSFSSYTPSIPTKSSTTLAPLSTSSTSTFSTQITSSSSVSKVTPSSTVTSTTVSAKVGTTSSATSSSQSPTTTSSTSKVTPSSTVTSTTVSAKVGATSIATSSSQSPTTTSSTSKVTPSSTATSSSVSVKVGTTSSATSSSQPLLTTSSASKVTPSSTVTSTTVSTRVGTTSSATSSSQSPTTTSSTTKTTPSSIDSKFSSITAQTNYSATPSLTTTTETRSIETTLANSTTSTDPVTVLATPVQETSLSDMPYLNPMNDFIDSSYINKTNTLVASSSLKAQNFVFEKLIAACFFIAYGIF